MVHGKEELIVTKGDLILEHKGEKLTDYYKVDSRVLGSGRRPQL